MSPDKSPQNLFNEALERDDPIARGRFLDDACGADAALRERVERLLRAHDEAGGFFSQPSKSAAQTSGTIALPVTEKPGDRIGRYKLLQQIGEGGCGVVYMAEQEEPVRRRVALKVIKLGMDTKQVIARFEAERQALALMDHPNIAKVFDAGATETGRPYFVMELVRGVKMTEFCDESKLPTEDRLKLFIQVCQAIQHAHQKGVIHRDIKPSNILVTVNDGVLVPKVIDFGIAKATAGHLTDQTLFTAFDQFIGTPAYMSPEQTVMTSVDIDTRSDIYSLGVLLYELLTGGPPFDQQELLAAGLDGMRCTIREQEPARPSNRLSAMAAEALTTTARHRHTEPPKLVHQVRGDLDWIVMKCLEKDRARRYETTNALATDIRRHLENEPITARPPSNVYRVRKLVRRNKLAVTAVGAVLLTLITGLGISTWQFVLKNRAYHRATEAEREQTRQRQIAETNEKRSDQVAHFLKEMLNGVGPSVALGRDTAMLKEILSQTANRVSKDLHDQPAVEGELLATVGNVYQQLGDYTNAAALLQKSLEVRRRFYGGDHLEVASSLSDLGLTFLLQGKFEDGENFQRNALAMQVRLLGTENLEVARTFGRLGDALRKQEKFTEAESHLVQALALRRKLLGTKHVEIADSLFHLGLLFNLQNKGAVAERYYRECLAMQQSLHGSRHPRMTDTLDMLALALSYQGKYTQAQKIQREALAMTKELYKEPHPILATRLHNLGFNLRQAGQLERAEPPLREALALRRKLLEPNHPDIAVTLIILAELQRQRKEYADAENLIQEAIAIRKKLSGAEDQRLISSFNVLEQALRAQGKLVEAETAKKELDALRKRAAAKKP